MIKTILKEGLEFAWRDLLKPLGIATKLSLNSLLYTTLNFVRYPYRGMMDAWWQFQNRHLAIRIGMAAVGAVCGAWYWCGSVAQLRATAVLFSKFFVAMHYILRRSSYLSILLLRKARAKLDRPSVMARLGWGAVGAIMGLVGYAVDLMRYSLTLLYTVGALWSLGCQALQELLPWVCQLKGKYYEPLSYQDNRSPWNVLLESTKLQVNTVGDLMQPVINAGLHDGFVVRSLGYHAFRTAVYFSERNEGEVAFDKQSFNDQWQTFKKQTGKSVYA